MILRRQTGIWLDNMVHYIRPILLTLVVNNYNNGEELNTNINVCRQSDTLWHFDRIYCKTPSGQYFKWKTNKTTVLHTVRNENSRIINRLTPNERHRWLLSKQDTQWWQCNQQEIWYSEQGRYHQPANSTINKRYDTQSKGDITSLQIVQSTRDMILKAQSKGDITSLQKVQSTRDMILKAMAISPVYK